MYNELTKNDIKKMEEEIEYRKLVVRKEALEAVKEARAQGDLSENFEYYAAKRDKNKKREPDPIPGADDTDRKNCAGSFGGG